MPPIIMRGDIGGMSRPVTSADALQSLIIMCQRELEQTENMLSNSQGNLFFP